MDWQNFQNKICSLDLESNEKGEIFAVGAVYRDKVFKHRAPFNIQQVLNEFDSFSREADYLLGHNIILHDLPFCHAINPKLAFFDKPVFAMITRYKSDSEEEFKARCKVEQWEVPMIEVFLNKKEICSLQAAS